jgi:methionine-rich copper-binding protein CopC
MSLLTLTAALAVSGLAAPAASAHDAFVGSTPAAGSTVATAPTEVRVSFEEPPLASGLGVAVTGPDGTSVASGQPTLVGSVVVRPLVPLTAAGAYTVAWRIVADDGHPVTGTFSFTLALPSSSTSNSTSSAVAASPGPTGTADVVSTDLTPWVVGGVVGLVLVVGVVGLLAVRRRPTP